MWAVTGTVVDTPPKELSLETVWSGPRHLTNLSRLEFVFRTAARGERILRRHDIDLIHHVLPYNIDATFNLLALAHRVPLVIGPVQAMHAVDQVDEGKLAASLSERGFEVTIARGPGVADAILSLAAGVSRRMAHRTARRATSFVAVSEAAVNAIHAVAPDAVVDLVPPGVDTSRFTIDHSTRRDEVLAVGYLVKRKRFELVIEMFDVLRREFPWLRLRIIGEGPERAALEQRAAELGLADVVTFDGFVLNAELPERYARAVAVCLPSTAEAAAAVPLEALACGVPVVGSATGIMPEIIRKTGAGAIATPAAAALAESVRALITDANERRRRGEAGRQYVVENHDWGVIVDRYREIYDGALSRFYARGRSSAN